MNFKSQNHRFKYALSSFAVFGLLLTLMLASLSTDWGVAYGQTAGPTPSPVVSQQDPAITKTADLTAATPGTTVRFTIIATNPGSLAANEVVVIDNVPNEFEVTGVTSSKGTISTNGQQVTVNIGTLAPGETVTIVVTTTVRPNPNNNVSVSNVATLNSDVAGRKASVLGRSAVMINPNGSVDGNTGIIPGLPYTGQGTNTAAENSWQPFAIAVLAVLTIAAGAAMFVTYRREKRS